MFFTFNMYIFKTEEIIIILIRQFLSLSFLATKHQKKKKKERKISVFIFQATHLFNLFIHWSQFFLFTFVVLCMILGILKNRWL